MDTFDIVLAVCIGWVAIGLLTFFLEIFLDGNVFEIITWDIWDSRTYDKWIGLIFLFVSCVGAWPMIIGFELVSKRR